MADQIQIPIAFVSATAAPIATTPSADIRYVSELPSNWRLQRLIPIAIEKDEGECYVASDNILNVYGEGETPEAAVRDYCGSLTEYFELVEEVASDHPPSRALLNLLQQYLVRASTK